MRRPAARHRLPSAENEPKLVAVGCDRLRISRTVLAERLKWLMAQGVLEQRVYSERPPRHEYLLTEKGWELADVLLAIAAWGDRWTAGDAGPPVLRRHRTCGEVTHAELAAPTAASSSTPGTSRSNLAPAKVAVKSEPDARLAPPSR
jgi:hypothetical protein